MLLPRTQSWSQPESLPWSDNLQDNDLILYTLCFGPNKTHSQGECPCIPVQVRTNRHSPPMREALWGPSPQTLSRGTPSRNQRGLGCVGAGWRRGPQHRGLRREAPAAVETRCPLSRKGGGRLLCLLLYSPGGSLARGFHRKRRDELWTAASGRGVTSTSADWGQAGNVSEWLTSASEVWNGKESWGLRKAKQKRHCLLCCLFSKTKATFWKLIPLGKLTCFLC